MLEEDEAGLLVDEAGLLVDEVGLLVDEAGLSVDEAGLSVDEAGLSVDEAGLSDDEAGLSEDEAGLSEEDSVLLSVVSVGFGADVPSERVVLSASVCVCCELSSDVPPLVSVVSVPDSEEVYSSEVLSGKLSLLAVQPLLNITAAQSSKAIIRFFIFPSLAYGVEPYSLVFLLTLYRIIRQKSLP